MFLESRVWENHKHGLMRRRWKRGGNAGAPVPYSTEIVGWVEIYFRCHSRESGNPGIIKFFAFEEHEKFLDSRFRGNDRKKLNLVKGKCLLGTGGLDAAEA